MVWIDRERFEVSKTRAVFTVPVFRNFCPRLVPLGFEVKVQFCLDFEAPTEQARQFSSRGV